MIDSSDYKHHCKYCKAKPHVAGPHHASNCKRYQSNLDTTSKEAMRYPCRHCGVKPFVEGAHHKKSCPRYEKPYTIFGTDELRTKYEPKTFNYDAWEKTMRRIGPYDWDK